VQWCLRIKNQSEALTETASFLPKVPSSCKSVWQAFEVYPAFQAEYWKPEFAALWAETDLLAAVARRQFANTQLAAVDPNVAARRAFKNVLDEFMPLLDGPEEPAHQFLKKHPEMISPTHTAAWSKLPLGAHSGEDDQAIRSNVIIVSGSSR
jgi:hypothetical protein